MAFFVGWEGVERDIFIFGRCEVFEMCKMNMN
jgi:hypothetical protein